MPSDRGYFKLWRDTFDHPVLRPHEPFTAFQFWVWLISEASYRPRDVKVPHGPIVHLERGQLTASMRFLAERSGWSIERVRRFVKQLFDASMVVVDVSTGQTVITICNYEQYQSDEIEASTGPRQGASTGPREGASTNKKEGKELKERKKRSYAHLADAPDGSLPLGDQSNGQDPEPPLNEYIEHHFAEWWHAYDLRRGRKAALKAYTKAVKGGATPAMLLEAARQYREHCRATDTKRKWPQGWLNDERWKDELPDPDADRQATHDAIAAGIAKAEADEQERNR